MSIPAIISNFLRTRDILKEIKSCLVKFIYLTSISISSHASEVGPLQKMEVLVRIEAQRVAIDQAHVSLYNKRFPIYAPDLDFHSVKEVKLVFKGLVRKAGLIGTTDLIPLDQVIYKHQFITINQEVKLPAPGDILHPFGLGGFWKPGCDLHTIEQFYSWFYESDEEIKYILKPLTYWQAKGSTPPLLSPAYHTPIDLLLQQPLSLVDAIREGRCTLQLNDETPEKDQRTFTYSSINIKAKGSYHAWLTLLQMQSPNYSS
jgi:hypothetical protein